MGFFSIDFHREAPSLEEAIRSAIAHVKSAGYEVERVETEAGAVAEHAYYENTGGEVTQPL